MPESSDPEMNDAELTPLADALRSLAPATTEISRDRLLFEAGRAAAAPPFAWLWPTSTLLFAGLSCALASSILFAKQPEPTIVERERIVEVRVPVVPEAPAEAPVPSGPRIEFTRVEPRPMLTTNTETVQMFKVRRDVLRWGPEMLPASKSVEKGMTASETARDLDRWLGVPNGTFSAPPQKSLSLVHVFGDE